MKTNCQKQTILGLMHLFRNFHRKLVWKDTSRNVINIDATITLVECITLYNIGVFSDQIQ